MIMVTTNFEDGMQNVKTGKGVTLMTFIPPHAHVQAEFTRTAVSDQFELSFELNKRQTEDNYFLDDALSSLSYMQLFMEKFSATEAHRKIIPEEVQVWHKIGKIENVQYFPSASVLIITILFDEEKCSAKDSQQRKLGNLIRWMGVQGVLLLLFAHKSALISPKLRETKDNMSVYPRVYVCILGPFHGTQIMVKVIKVRQLETEKVKSQRDKTEKNTLLRNKKRMPVQQVGDHTCNENMISTGFSGHFNNSSQEGVMFPQNGKSPTQNISAETKKQKKVSLQTKQETLQKAHHSENGDAGQQKRKGNNQFEKNFQNMYENINPLDVYTSNNDKNRNIEQICPSFTDKNGNDNLIATFNTPDKNVQGPPDAGQSAKRDVSSRPALVGNTQGLPEGKGSDEHSDKSVPDGREGNSAALSSHTQETESCATLDSNRPQGIAGCVVHEGVSGRDERKTTEKAESYDKTDQKFTDGDMNNCFSESCTGETGASSVAGTEQSSQTTGTNIPNFLIDEEDEGKTPKSVRSVVSFSDDNSLNSSELNTPDTEAGTTDIVQSISQADAEAQSTENGSENESVGESDQVKTDQSKDADDPCPEDTSLSESVTHRTDAGERTMSSETFSSNNDSPPNLMCEVEDCVIDVKKQLSGVLHTAPIDRGLLEGKKQSPSSQPGVPCPPTLNEQKLAPRVQSFPGQQTPGLDSPLGASQRPAEQERLELDKERSLHWTLHRFRPRDSVRSRPRHSDQAGTQTQTIPADLRQRMRQRNYRIASMLHLVSSLPVGVVELADAGLYYDEDTDEICCYKCSWRISRRGFCDVQDLANTHLCSLNTGGDVTTSQGREADREDDQTARTSEADRDVARQDCLQRGSACSEPKPVTGGQSMLVTDPWPRDSSAIAEQVSSEQGASAESVEASELQWSLPYDDSGFYSNACAEKQTIAEESGTRASHTGDTSHPITCASGVASAEEVVVPTRQQPADDDGMFSSDVDNYKSRQTSPPDLCLKQRYGTAAASKCDLEADGEKAHGEVAETHASSLNLDRGSPAGHIHLRSGLDAASALSEEESVSESPTWDEHVGNGSSTHGVNAGITQETHDGNDNVLQNIHSAVQNALENNDDAESVTQDVQSDSDTTTLGTQSGGNNFS